MVIHAACTAYEGLSVVSPVFVTRNTYDATVNVLSASIKPAALMSAAAPLGSSKYSYGVS